VRAFAPGGLAPHELCAKANQLIEECRAGQRCLRTSTPRADISMSWLALAHNSWGARPPGAKARTMAAGWTLAARPPCPCRRRRRWQSPPGAAEADGVEVVAAHHARGLASGRQIASVNLRQRNGHERLLDFTGTLEILLMNLERAALGFHSLFELAVARLETAPGARVQFYTAGKQHHDDNYQPGLRYTTRSQVFASRVSSMRRFPTAAAARAIVSLNANENDPVHRRPGRSHPAAHRTFQHGLQRQMATDIAAQRQLTPQPRQMTR